MFSASSLLRYQRPPFKTGTASGFVASRLFRTSINKSIRQANNKCSSPSPTSPLWKRLTTKNSSLYICFKLDKTIFRIQKWVASYSFPTKLVAKFSIFVLYEISVIEGSLQLWKLIESPSPWISYAGYAIVLGPICFLFYDIRKQNVSFWLWQRLARKVFLFVSLPISALTLIYIGRKLAASYPNSPPRIKKSLEEDFMLGSVNDSGSKDCFTSYQYEVLPQDYIRLVQIKPGKAEDPIQLELMSIKFRPQSTKGWGNGQYIPRYEALSYTWDEHEQKDNVKISLNGESFYITPNLNSALLAFRRKAISTTFWIDAICIDQKDTTEKEQQLRIMNEIYKHAASVRIWLGSEDQSVDIRAALALISHCLTKVEETYGPRYSKLESNWNMLLPIPWGVLWKRARWEFLFTLLSGQWADREKIAQKYLKESEKEPIIYKIDWHTGPEYSSGWKAIKNILTRSYFTRSWIIQEMALSSNRSIFVGDYDVTDILRFVKLLYKNPEIGRQLPSECCIEPEVISRIQNLIWPMLRYKSFGVMSLGDLLISFRGKKSTLPQDQIYSLLGLTGDYFLGPSGLQLPNIDYKQSTKQLCTDTMKYILTQTNRLDALQMLTTHAKPKNEEDWPSWVPDFTCPLPGLGDPKSAGWLIPEENCPEEMREFHIENDKLLVYGHVLSEIREPIGRRDKHQEYQKERTAENYSPRFDPEFLPVSVWRDNNGREVHGSLGMKKGDLVVAVYRGMSPLILRRLKDVQGIENQKGNESYEYNVIGTAHISGINTQEFYELERDLVWGFRKMIII